MSEEAFVAAIRELSNLTDDQKSRLLEAAAKLDPQLRAEIIKELQENYQREKDILENGLVTITGIERTIENRVRMKNEDADRQSEQSQLPNFDSIPTNI